MPKYAEELLRNSGMKQLVALIKEDARNTRIWQQRALLYRSLANERQFHYYDIAYQPILHKKTRLSMDGEYLQCSFDDAVSVNL
jgi:hypothetical protein